jgi:predicted Zn-dependent peptidase
VQEIQFERTLSRNIRIHVLPTDRFKTYAISLYIGSPLTEDHVTPNALIPFVLRRGTTAYPETRRYRERLDELYGAGFGFDIYKRGNHQLVSFRMDTISDRYIGADSEQALLKESLVYLLQTVCAPALEDGKFLRKYVDSEIITVRKRLESIINNKIQYAAERCTQEMFQNDPFRFNALGRLDQLDQINTDMLYKRYMEWLSSAQMDLYVVGDTTLEAVREIVQELFTVDRGELVNYQFKERQREPRSAVHQVVEQLDVNQGKLNMGLTIPVYQEDKQYPAAMMYNGILGGYPHSKLFTNVREKASLAYYASSRMDGFKGMLMIQSGIEVNHYDKAVRIIEEQLEALANGIISDTEMNQTKAMMINQLRETNDSAFDIIGFDFASTLINAKRTLSSVIASIQEVTKADVEAIAKQVKLDTIYFLRDRKGE